LTTHQVETPVEKKKKRQSFPEGFLETCKISQRTLSEKIPCAMGEGTYAN